MNGILINLTHSVDDVDRTSVAMVVACASVASAPGFFITTSSGRSSHLGCGTATQAAMATAG